MTKVDQRRFDNQPADFLSAREAARLLGVKLRTLYAYASRGLLGSVPSGRGRARLYSRAEVERLKARSDARSGHTAVAAGALRWGEPVLESAITSIGPDGIRYRGRALDELLRGERELESVAELLWSGTLPQARLRWPVEPCELELDALSALVRGAPPLVVLSVAVVALAAADRGRHVSAPRAELARARQLVRCMAAALACGARPERVNAALAAPTTAGVLLRALGGAAGPRQRAAVDAALIACADHELNASTFAARVAASTGADLYACVSAALAALSGPLHGAASDRVEALLDEVGSPRRAARVLAERLRRGEALPGFGHPLYPAGDPRARLLLERARRLGPAGARLRRLSAVVRGVRALGGPEPNLDLGLVALVSALGLERGSAAALFAVGRAAGWIAHALEQRAAGFLLRPRARYVGPSPTSASDSSA